MGWMERAGRYEGGNDDEGYTASLLHFYLPVLEPAKKISLQVRWFSWLPCVRAVWLAVFRKQCR